MKIVVIVGIILLILVDVFVCYQVLRAEALGEMHYPPEQGEYSRSTQMGEGEENPQL